MRFEVSEQIRTRKEKAAIVDALEVQLRKISRKVERTEDSVTATAIEASFGSINRYDKSVFQVRQKEGGFLCIADVTYRPSLFFWLFFAIGLFAYFLLWWPPIIFYLVQRKTVRSAIADVFTRVRNEFELDATSGRSNLEHLERLALLKEKGMLSEAEFESHKRELLGSPISAASAAIADNENLELIALRKAAEKRRLSKLMVGVSLLFLFVAWMTYLMIWDHAPSPAVIPRRSAETATH